MFKISFDFNEQTKTVSNVKVVSLDSTTASSNSYDMRVEENKVSLTLEAVNKLGAVAGDRISINYWTVDNTTTYPIISKSDVFTDGQDGSKLTKRNTFSFKGQQRISLLKFGETFEFSEFTDKNGEVKEGVYVLTPTDNKVDESDFSLENEASNDLDDKKVEDEIDKILAEDNYDDDLPF